MARKMTATVGLSALCLWFGAGLAHADLIAHWKLDEPAGTEGLDSILDSGPEEAYHGTPTFTAGASILFEQPGATDTTGTSASFTEAQGGIDVPYDEALNPPSFTFCVWARATDTVGYGSVVTSRHDNLP